jgi:hypothetical protein
MAKKRKALTAQDKLIRDLEKTFTIALEGGNLTAALKAKELIAKLLEKHPAPPRAVEDLSSEALDALIERLQEGENT